MPFTLDQIYQEATSLPGEAKVRLVEKLVAHIESSISPELEREHLDVAEKRRDEVRAGSVQPVDGEAALADVRHAIRE